MPPTINELTVEVTTNTFGKMQYYPPFDRIGIVLDQCRYNIKLIQGSLLSIHSNICRGTSVLFFRLFKFKVLPKDLKIKKIKKQ